MEKYNLIKELRKDYHDSFIGKSFEDQREIHSNVLSMCSINGIHEDIILMNDEVFEIMTEKVIFEKYIF